MTPIIYCINCGVEIDRDEKSDDWYHLGRNDGKEMICDPARNWRDKNLADPGFNK